MLKLRNSYSVACRLSFTLSLLLTPFVFCCGVSAQKTAANWTREFPSQSPAPRYDFAMSICQNGNVLVFGGTSVESAAYLNDTWLWDGFNWHDLSSQSNRPPARAFANMAFDQVHNQVVMFGGRNPPAVLSDTWVFNGNFWIKMNPSTIPLPRFGASMTYDGRQQRIVLFGGRESDNTYLGDSWAWNGSTWVDLATLHRPASFAANLVYYPPGGYDVLFGGIGPLGLITDTFYLGPFSILNSGLPDWLDANEIDPNFGNPPSRLNASMAYYPVAAKILLFGGGFLDQNVYSYNGVWNVEHPIDRPPSLSGARMAYHPNTGRLVYFGGINTSFQDFNQTWTWGKQVACLPGDGSTVRVGSTVRCFFKEDPDVHFGYWTTDGFSPNSTTTLNKTFHTNGPGPASITATWFDSTGMHNETFHFTTEHGHQDRDDDLNADRD